MNLLVELVFFVLGKSFSLLALLLLSQCQLDSLCRGRLPVSFDHLELGLSLLGCKLSGLPRLFLSFKLLALDHCLLHLTLRLDDLPSLSLFCQAASFGLFCDFLSFFEGFEAVEGPLDVLLVTVLLELSHCDPLH